MDLPPVTVARSGGFAGVSDQYGVAPDGTVSVSGVSAKKLAAADLDRLRTLITGGAFADEAKRGPYTSPNCRDGFNYTVTAGTVRVAGTDCGDLAKRAPTLWAVIELVSTAAQGS